MGEGGRGRKEKKKKDKTQTAYGSPRGVVKRGFCLGVGSTQKEQTNEARGTRWRGIIRKSLVFCFCLHGLILHRPSSGGCWGEEGGNRVFLQGKAGEKNEKKAKKSKKKKKHVAQKRRQTEENVRYGEMGI